MQRTDLGGESGLCLALGPQQFVGKFAQSGGVAFFPEDQRLLKRLLPALEFSPDMSVGQLQGLGCSGNRACCSYSLQQVHQWVAQGAGLIALRRFVLMWRPAVRKIDVLHKQEFALIVLASAYTHWLCRMQLIS